MGILSLALSLTLLPVLQEEVALQERTDLEALEAALGKGARAQKLVGFAAAFVEDGEIHEFFLGFEDREEEIEVGTDTKFRWASISKPLTAVAAMQLARADRLDLDADVREYVPEFPEKPWPVTARQLTGHLGGIVHYRNGKVVRTEREYDQEHPFESVILALDMFKESPLVAEPGTKYSYTTHGYILLSACRVERAGGAPFADQVKKRVLDPLGMDTCRPDYQWTDIEHRALGYKRVGTKIFPSTNTDVSWKLGGGGYVSNVGDLARFARGLMGEEILDREAWESMWTPMKTAGGEDTGYGMGFGIRDVDGKRRVSHSGSQEKTRTLMQVFPEEGRALVLMTNSEWANLGVIAEEGWAAIRD